MSAFYQSAPYVMLLSQTEHLGHAVPLAASVETCKSVSIAMIECAPRSLSKNVRQQAHGQSWTGQDYWFDALQARR